MTEQIEDFLGKLQIKNEYIEIIVAKMGVTNIDLMKNGVTVEDLVSEGIPNFQAKNIINKVKGNNQKERKDKELGGVKVEDNNLQMSLFNQQLNDLQVQMKLGREDLQNEIDIRFTELQESLEHEKKKRAMMRELEREQQLLEVDEKTNDSLLKMKLIDSKIELEMEKK